MDRVRIPITADLLPRGSSYFLPFECFNIKENGSFDSKLAVDLPPLKSMHHARLFVANNRGLVGRAIQYQEYGADEIKRDLQLMNYMQLHGSKL